MTGVMMAGWVAICVIGGVATCVAGGASSSSLPSSTLNASCRSVVAWPKSVANSALQIALISSGVIGVIFVLSRNCFLPSIASVYMKMRGDALYGHEIAGLPGHLVSFHPGARPRLSILQSVKNLRVVGFGMHKLWEALEVGAAAAVKEAHILWEPFNRGGCPVRTYRHSAVINKVTL
eukprot:GDKK01024925.1.p1 GENE.GDKK01024925.1~~GDKK01024925.1.p1  ORF type:complete len:178 (-),score=5.06 GDKK01024925.1:303-836(-)